MKKNVSLNIFVRFILAAYLTMALSLGVYFLVVSLNLFEEKYFEYEKYTASYSAKQNYKVQLKENSIYDKSLIEENKTYISNLVEEIPIKYEIDFISSDDTLVEYAANSYAVLSITHRVSGSDKPLILERVYELQSSEGVLNDKMTDEIILDFEFFESEAEAIVNNLDVHTRSELKIYYNVELSNDYFDERVSFDKKIPLLESAFTISKSNNSTQNIVITEKDYFDLEDDYLLASLGLFIVTISLMFLIVWRNKIFFTHIKTEFEKTRDKLLKEHDEVIIEIVTPVDKSGLSIIYVKNFHEMLDLEEGLRIPINYYEDERRAKGEFSLRHGEVLYVLEI